MNLITLAIRHKFQAAVIVLLSLMLVGLVVVYERQVAYQADLTGRWTGLPLSLQGITKTLR